MRRAPSVPRIATSFSPSHSHLLLFGFQRRGERSHSGGQGTGVAGASLVKIPIPPDSDSYWWRTLGREEEEKPPICAGGTL